MNPEQSNTVGYELAARVKWKAIQEIAIAACILVGFIATFQGACSWWSQEPKQITIVIPSETLQDELKKHPEQESLILKIHVK